MCIGSASLSQNCHCHVISTLYKPDTSLRQTVGAGPDGVRLRELTVFTFTFICLQCRDKTQIRKILLLYVGSVLDAQRFDTHGDRTAGDRLGEFLDKQRGE